MKASDIQAFSQDQDSGPGVLVNPDPDSYFIWPKKIHVDQKKFEKILYIKSGKKLYIGIHEGLLCYRKSLQPSKENI